MINFSKKISIKIVITFSLSVLVLLFTISAGTIEPPNNKNELLLELIKINDNNIPNAIKKQWTAKENPYCGALFDADGQNNERSTSVYTPVTNRSLREIAKRMNYDYLYKRNCICCTS